MRHLFAFTLIPLLLAGWFGVTRTYVEARSDAPAFTGFATGALVAPVVDPVRHLVFGLTNHGVRVLDEATGRSRLLSSLGRRLSPILLAVDPRAHRLLVEATRFDRIVGPARAGPATITALAVVINEGTGQIVAIASVSTFLQYVALVDEGSVAVDSLLQHGFVTDYGGQGIMIDMHSGHPLARFRSGNAASFFSGFLGSNPAVVDERSHHLFVATLPPGSRSTNGTPIPDTEIDAAVISTASGRVLRYLRLGLGLGFDVALDPKARRMVETGANWVSIVNADTLRRVRRLPVDFTPQYLAIDTKHHQLFLLTSYLSGTKTSWRLIWIDYVSGQIHVNGHDNNVSMRQLIAPDIGAVDITAGRLFVLPNATGTIDIFSTSSGNLLASLSLSTYGKLGNIGIVAIDEGAHRLIIGGTGGALVVATEPPYRH